MPVSAVSIYYQYHLIVRCFKSLPFPFHPLCLVCSCHSPSPDLLTHLFLISSSASLEHTIAQFTCRLSQTVYLWLPAVVFQPCYHILLTLLAFFVFLPVGLCKHFFLSSTAAEFRDHSALQEIKFFFIHWWCAIWFSWFSCGGVCLWYTTFDYMVKRNALIFQLSGFAQTWHLSCTPSPQCPALLISWLIVTQCQEDSHTVALAASIQWS